jgi:hypothetical protein
VRIGHGGAANSMLRPLAGQNHAPPACGASWAGPLARLEVVFYFFSPVFFICAGFFFFLVFSQDFGSAGFLLIFHFIYFIFFSFSLKIMKKIICLFF